MIRLFENNSKTYALDKRWSFKTDEKDVGTDEKWYLNFPSDSSLIYVPSCWNNELGLFEYEGTAWYKTEFFIESESVHITFGAVSGECVVYVDGKLIGEHYGSFCEFGFTIDNLGNGKHTLVVKVNNTLNDLNSVPLRRVDWKNYGGIIRSVEITEFDKAFVKHIKTSYSLSNDYKNANLSAEITLYSTEKISETVSLYIDGNKVWSTEARVCGETKIKAENILVEDIKLWDIYCSNLYTVKAEISNFALNERIGFREIKTENKKIYLNGKEIFIKGVNRHEEHFDWGFAMPFKLIKRDIDIIKNMGCNAVRGSHYPNSKATLDLLDEEGILFWEEVPMWGYPEEAIKDSLTQERVLSMNKEMLVRDVNHPCVVIWGLHNEIDTTSSAARKLSEKLVRQIKSYDKSRLITFASNRRENDICLDLVDFISINCYFGWYSESIEYWSKHIKNLGEYMKKLGIYDKPVVVSEFGAGGVFGESYFEDVKWTENYQEKYLDYTVNQFFENDDISGMYIWQYCDIRTSEALCLSRPRSFNNKGLVNEHRQPKRAYSKIKELYERYDKYGK